MATELRNRIGQHPILMVTGPRQYGKTTLVKTLFTDYVYVSLENPDQRSFAKEDPNGFLKQYANKTILDEVQRVPELFSYLQTAVDGSGLMGNISFDCNISQPTARAWLSVLESSYLVFLLNPYHENFNKRLVKTPKLYFMMWV